MIPKKHYIITTLIMGVTLLFCNTNQVGLYAQHKPPVFYMKNGEQNKWVDSILSTMSVKDKLAQLMMVAAYSNKDKAHENKTLKLIKDYGVGGLIFMQGTPKKQVDLTNLYQSNSKVPLLIGFDGEWGLSMRLKNSYKYPWNLTLGAVQDTALIRMFGERLGEQCKRIGININFAPVVDLNTNPKNPIIGNRSFGSDPDMVTRHALAFTNGMQSQQVLACAKHFPGHGDTSEDSHKTLPSVNFSLKRLEKVELKPYKILAHKGLAAIMPSHLSVPALESNPKLPTSLSKKVITGVLKQRMRYKGLIITDALNMKGVADYTKTGELELQAFLAGNDILLFPENVPKALEHLLNAYNQGAFDIFQLDRAVVKILLAKYYTGLNHRTLISTENLSQDLINVKDTLLHRQLVEASITALKHKSSQLPIQNLTQNIAYLKLGEDKDDVFYHMMLNYAKVKTINPKKLNGLSDFNTIIIGIFKSNANPWKSYKLTSQEHKIIENISKNHNVILSVFTSPYALLDLKTQDIENIIISYQNSTISKELTAQKIFGGLGFNGKLPVTLPNFSFGSGANIPSLKRLSFGLPQEEHINTKKLAEIDSIANLIISKKMAPGLQILIARHGKVFYHKSFGYFTYKKKHQVTNENLYDLASMTKILGGLPLMMKAFEDSKYKLNSKLKSIIPEAKNTNKANITVKEALSHVGRLHPWIPYYKATLDRYKKPLPVYYRTKPEELFKSRVAEDLYLRSDFQDSIYKQIFYSKLRPKSGYKYSDLFFTLIKKYIENTYKTPMNQLIDSVFYKKLGANRLTYLPLQKFDKDNIIPSEIDHYFRHQTLQGDVHDMAAAMMNGVSGHAGLFGNSLDVAKLMQMYLQEGFYGGKYFFKSSTFNTFNQQHYASKKIRRGLGFDKPQINPKEKATCGCVSLKSFGHSGFTGTYTWADPETGTLYVFLSNRTYPSMENKKLITSNARTIIQKLIQESVIQ